jgi:hypothetical protein
MQHPSIPSHFLSRTLVCTLVFTQSTLIACKDNPNRHLLSLPPPKKFDTTSKYPWVARENDREALIAVMEGTDCAYFGGIGIAGEESEVYDCYKRLLAIAPDSMWLRLSHHTKPVVRMYAYRALQQKNSPDYGKVKRWLARDTATVCEQAGCTIMTFSLKEFIAWENKSK